MASAAAGEAPGAPAGPLSREKCTFYTACYCEENVYKLCSALVEAGLAEMDELYAVFISNRSKMVPIWCQRASQQPGGLVCWDYHVILLQRHLRRPDPPAAADDDDGARAARASSGIAASSSSSSTVWDLDTTLGLPCSFQQYSQQALRSPAGFLTDSRFHRRYRVVPARLFLEHFASDRSHMLCEDGTWKAQPPAYPCIVAQGGATMTLYRYWNMRHASDGSSGGGGGSGSGSGSEGEGEEQEQGGGADDDDGRFGRVLLEEEMTTMFGAQALV